MRDVKGFLGNKQSEAGPLSSEWAALEELYDKRLWHQLTLSLVEFVKNEYFEKNGGLLEMHDNFLSDFEHRINPLTLMEISLYIVKEHKDPEKAIQFLEKQREKVKNVLEADILCLTAIGNIRLAENKLDETKTVIAQAREMLDTIDGVSAVHDRFYSLCSNFHKITGSYNDYYRDGLRYLGCVELTSLSDTEKIERALHLALAALLGSDVYNFGELLAHEVLKYIKGTEHNWLVDLLYAFNSGNLKKFEDLRPYWSKQPDMLKNEKALQQKIRLLCLMELTFNRPSNDRNLSFAMIAQEAKVPENEVELLVMKALSLGLVKGSIDEVEQMVHMTWVQPRVLDQNQIANMRDRLTVWCDKVKTQVHSVEDEVPELIV
ncbi:26S proteasome non-ATPase regulatory subunit 13 [Exaiptasia diaphana]|uniref:26S proteasome non-ATPase regulatory subunit 13 n=1 Tax=Exaiptasia diaphana TaxID=2652724 RepID=A0A913X8T2_EXADI|nr:26S proteasome non-ATPase regulatory subunit 13 [Exaiptasia diaphana]KXJ14016.1 26S proteasome non-ATPase regulatory subunit 13 [Exaiptasia diaphana]